MIWHTNNDIDGNSGDIDSNNEDEVNVTNNIDIDNLYDLDIDKSDRKSEDNFWQRWNI